MFPCSTYRVIQFVALLSVAKSDPSLQGGALSEGYSSTAIWCNIFLVCGLVSDGVVLQLLSM